MAIINMQQQEESEAETEAEGELEATEEEVQQEEEVESEYEPEAEHIWFANVDGDSYRDCKKKFWQLWKQEKPGEKLIVMTFKSTWGL